MSILGESNPEENNNNPPPAANRYGGLKSNKKARNRRDKVKFFDSADWAMKNQNTQGNADQEAEGNLPRANFQQIPDQVDQDGKSVLANDSPLEQSALAGDNNGDNNGSPLSGGDNDGASPLSGCSPLA